MSNFKDDIMTKVREAELEYQAAQQRADELRRKRDRLKSEMMSRLQQAEEQRKVRGSTDTARPAGDAPDSRPVQPEGS